MNDARKERRLVVVDAHTRIPFGEALKRAIAGYGESVGRAANRFGVSKRHLHDVFNGAAPSKPLLIKLRRFDAALMARYANNMPTGAAPAATKAEASAPTLATLREITNSKKPAPSKPSPAPPIVLAPPPVVVRRPVPPAAAPAQEVEVEHTPQNSTTEQPRLAAPPTMSNTPPVPVPAENKEPKPTSFGEALRALRTKAGLTQDAMGTLVGSNGKNISKFELNDLIPNAKEAAALFAVLPELADAPLPKIKKRDTAPKAKAHVQLPTPVHPRAQASIQPTPSPIAVLSYIKNSPLKPYVVALLDMLSRDDVTVADARNLLE